jgi:hypothetical protein
MRHVAKELTGRGGVAGDMERSSITYINSG